MTASEATPAREAWNLEASGVGLVGAADVHLGFGVIVPGVGDENLA